MKKTKRFLAMLLTLMLCVGEFASTGFSAFAADDEKIKDTVPVTDTVGEDENEAHTEEASGNEVAEPEDVTAEEIMLGSGTNVDLSTIADTAYTAKDGDVLSGVVTNDFYFLYIEDGATVTFRNLSIEESTGFRWAECKGDATIILEGNNSLSNQISVRADKTLTIKGDGYLTVNTYRTGAAIGGAGNIVIEGGTIYAYGDYGSAGIGASDSSSCGDITIKGGTIYAYGGSDAAGIGSGEGRINNNAIEKSECKDITITGGTVYAYGGTNAAGIGSGATYMSEKSNEDCSKCNSVTITSGVDAVYAKRGEDSRGIKDSDKTECIGKGFGGNCGDIRIDSSLKDSTIDDIRIITKNDTVVASAEDVLVRYDGKPHGITVSVKQPVSGTTVKYGTSPLNINQSSLTFTDAGEYKVYYKVTAEGYTPFSGVATVEILTAVQEEPPAPTVKSVTNDSVTLNTIENGEYIYYVFRKYEDDFGITRWGWRSGCAFQDSPTFTGLSEDTTYRFAQRYKELPNYYESPISNDIEVTTGVQGHNVVFNTNGHGTKATVSHYIENGKTVTRPDDPVDVDGWIFKGWFNEASCITEFDFDTPITEDTIIYAKWEEEVRYDIWIGRKQVTETNQTDIFGNGTACYTPETNTLSFNEAEITNGYEYASGKIAGVYAKDMSLTISGKAEINNVDIAVCSNDDIVLKDADLKLISATNVIKAKNLAVEDGKLTAVSTSSEDDSVIKAEAKVTINGGESFIATDGQNGDCINTPELEINAGTTKLISGGASGYGIIISKGFVMNDGSLDVTTEEEEYFQGGSAIIGTGTATVQINGGTINTNSDMEAIYAGGGITLSDDVKILEPEGGKLSEDGKKITKNDGSTAYKVKIDTVTYTVTFNMNGLGTAIVPAEVKAGKTIESPVVSLVEGYTFEGWFTDEAGTKAYVFTTPVNANIILYAKWKGVDRTVTFDMGGKGSDITEKVENGQPVFRPETDPVADGYTFTSWFADEECTTEYNFDMPITKDTIIYAGWKEGNDPAKGLTVSFNMMDHGTAIPAQTVSENGKVERPDNPAEVGWVFGGWFKEEGCVNEYNFNEPVKESFTLYAKWTEEKESVSKGISALDNRPVINETTTDIYLVKGQRFYIGKEWAVADPVAKRYVNINKKGYLMAKKPDPESVTVKIKKEGRADITVHICQPALSDKKMNLEITNETPNPTQTLTITKDNGIKNVLWYSAAPDVATVDQNGKVTAVAKGKAKITAYVNGKAYNCNITVKESFVAKNRTLHVNLQGAKKISVKGVKNWIGADETIAEKVNNADKFKAMKVGKTVLSASVNDIKYTIDFYAEDITVNGEKVSGGNKNKYTIDNLQVGTATDISLPGVKQDVVFKSSKPDVVFIDEAGKITARSKGTAKLTTKINGKTITITVRVVE